MGMHGGGWWAFIRYDEERDRPKVTRELIRGVWGFARPYGRSVVGLVLTILLISGVSLISPLLYRDLIDNAIPKRDVVRLNWLALGMIAVPVVNGLIGVLQRQVERQHRGGCDL